ncbi:MAG: sigma-70 family RNA polymerase sigma factor [Actinomycetota bacterium]
MSVGFGDGPAASPQAPPPPGVHRPDLPYVFDQWAGPLVDYCESVTGHRAEAARAVQDTLIAAQQRIGELRDPDRERSWFYALARLRSVNGSLGADKNLGADRVDGDPDEDGYGDLFTSEGHPGQPSADTAELGIPDLEAEALRRESLAIVTAAMAGLAAEDREVLNLSFRHQLDELDLPAVLGLPLGRVRSLLSGASGRFTQSATAIAALRSGLAGCQTLESIAGGWDPESPVLAPEVRKRLARHIRSCVECTDSLKGRGFGPELLSVQLMAPAPAAFRQRVLAAGADPGRAAYRREVAARLGSFGPDGFPAVRPTGGRGRTARPGPGQGRVRRRTLVALAAALVIIAVAVALWYALPGLH